MTLYSCFRELSYIPQDEHTDLFEWIQQGAFERMLLKICIPLEIILSENNTSFSDEITKSIWT